ncbi:MAG: caspase family protein, partial [Hyphomicrobium sp.]
LVIGNSNYTKLPYLTNPRNDAELMDRTLRKLGFEVVFAIDANRIAIARAVRTFGRQRPQSGDIGCLSQQPVQGNDAFGLAWFGKNADSLGFAGGVCGSPGSGCNGRQGRKFALY